MIKIGVSSCFLYPDTERSFFAPKTLCFLENDMANYLCREGVMPVLIPDLKGAALNHLLSQMDGFVFQGGSDVCPKMYSESFLDEIRWPGDEKRDRYELAIADYAFKHGKPMLGICRGAQLLNVYFGGTLYQDLPTEFTSEIKHKDPIEYDQLHHAIKFMPDNILQNLYEDMRDPQVGSVHHQGIKKLGKGLVVEAVSPDNLVEAFSHQSKDNFVLGVQWHPEFSYSIKHKVIPGEPIYDCFLQKVRNS